MYVDDLLHAELLHAISWKNLNDRHKMNKFFLMFKISNNHSAPDLKNKIIATRIFSGVARGYAFHAENNLNFFKAKIFFPNFFQILSRGMPCSIGAKLERDQQIPSMEINIFYINLTAGWSLTKGVYAHFFMLKVPEDDFLIIATHLFG